MKKLCISMLILICGTWNVQAAPPTRAYTYVSNTIIDPSQNNANENALYSYLQTGVDTFAAGSVTGAAISSSANIPYTSLSLTGSILNADVNASAGIVDTKLATISTAGKVSGAALTSLASIPSGAGVIPTANIPPVQAQMKIVTFTKNVSDSSTTQVVTGVGFTPRMVIFLSSRVGVNSVAGSVGLDNGTNHYAYSNKSIATPGDVWIDDSFSIALYVGSAGSDSQVGAVSAFSSDGFTISWTKSGSPASVTYTVVALAIG